MDEHTKLPWHASRKSRYVSDINHNVIAEIAPLHAFEANAALIVEAVNNHARLTLENEALRTALTELYAMVQGECPALLNEDSGGDASLDCEIRIALSLKDSEDAQA